MSNWWDDPHAGERVERAWRLARSQADQLREDGDGEGAARVLQLCGDHNGAEPGSQSSSRRQVRDMELRADEREHERRRERRRQPSAEDVNEERRLNGQPPMSVTSIELARRLTGA